MKFLYLCDRKKCKNCSYPECKHTSDISHAKNRDKKMKFKQIESNEGLWKVEE